MMAFHILAVQQERNPLAGTTAFDESVAFGRITNFRLGLKGNKSAFTRVPMMLVKLYLTLMSNLGFKTTCAVKTLTSLFVFKTSFEN